MRNSINLWKPKRYLRLSPWELSGNLLLGGRVGLSVLCNFSSFWCLYMWKSEYLEVHNGLKSKAWVTSSVGMSVCSLDLSDLVKMPASCKSEVLGGLQDLSLCVISHGTWAMVKVTSLFFWQCYWRAYAVGDVEKMALVKLAKWVKGVKRYWYFFRLLWYGGWAFYPSSYMNVGCSSVYEYWSENLAIWLERMTLLFKEGIAFLLGKGPRMNWKEWNEIFMSEQSRKTKYRSPNKD